MEKKENKKREDLSGKISAILFAAGDPVSLQKLARFLKVSRKILRQEIEGLNEKIKNNNLGLDFIFNQGKVQMVSSNSYADLVIKFFNKQLDEKISKAALETLAIVAYRGPTTRAEIEYIRGVNCSFTLRNLAMRGLVDFKENPKDNRSYLYQISGELLKNLGINEIKDLPEYNKLSQKEDVSRIRDNEKEEE